MSHRIEVTSIRTSFIVDVDLQESRCKLDTAGYKKALNLDTLIKGKEYLDSSR
jgi:hypothetical protein